MEVIPVINCPDRDFKCANDKVESAKKFLKKGDWLHLDVSDGRFTFNKSWGNPTQWANLRSGFNLEVHLMTEEPWKHIEPWLAAEAKRFILHCETMSEEDARRITREAKRGTEFMLASVPHTTTAELWPYLKFFSHYQVLAVHPGPAGQNFLPSVINKIKFLRNFAPNAKIEVDGGITPETAKLVKKFGANVVVSSSYIFDNKDPRRAYKKLQKI